MKHSIYLLNDQFTELAQVHMSQIAPTYIEIDTIEDAVDFEFKFYLNTAESKDAPWHRFYDQSVQFGTSPRTSAADSFIVLVCRITEDGPRIFCIAGGPTGWRVVKDDMKEIGFGLRVALNTILKSGFKRASTNKVAGSVKQRYTTLGNHGLIQELDFDRDLDMVAQIQGKSKNEAFASSIQGADSLIVTSKQPFSKFGYLLDQAYQYFKMEDYKADYGFVDKFRPISSANKSLIYRLEARLLDTLNGNHAGDYSLMVPGKFLDGNDYEWRYRYRSGNEHDEGFLDFSVVRLLFDSLKPGEDFTREEVFQSSVFNIVPIDDGSPLEIDGYSLYDLLSAEVELDGKSYVVQGKRWMLVSQDYLAEMNRALSEIKVRTDDMRFPDWPVDTANPKQYLNEETYNKQVSHKNKRMLNLDRNNLKIADFNKNSLVEICDLFTQDREFIFVKRAETSDRLSKLFDQGLVSLETLFNHSKSQTVEFLKSKIAENPGSNYYKSFHPDRLREIKFVFAIGTKRNAADLPLKLPFFAKVILYRTLQRAAVYCDKPIEIIHIPVDPKKRTSSPKHTTASKIAAPMGVR